MVRVGQESRVRRRLLSSDFLVGGFSVLAGIAILVYVQSFPTLDGGAPGPGLFPGIIGALFIIFGGVLAAKSFRKGNAKAAETSSSAETDDDPETDDPGVWTPVGEKSNWLNGVVVIASIVFYLLAAEILGFSVTMFLVLATLMLFLKSRLVVALVTAAGITFLLYAVFELILLVQLPNGIWR